MLFYKMINNLLPEYTMDPVPQLLQPHYSQSGCHWANKGKN